MSERAQNPQSHDDTSPSNANDTETDDEDTVAIDDVSVGDVLKVRNRRHVQTVRVTDVFGRDGYGTQKIEGSLLESTRDLPTESLPPTVTAHIKQVIRKVDDY